MALTPFQTPGAEQARLSTAAAHQLKVRHIQRIVTPTIAYNMADLANYNPNLDAGVIGGLSMAGVTPDDPVMELVSERQQYLQEEDTKYGKDGGIFGEWVWNPFKGLLRGGFMGLEGLMQEAESLLVRTPVGMSQGMSFNQALNQSGRSDAFHAINALTQGKRVHTGTGIFAQNQAEDDAYIQEQLATGRNLADVMGSREYGEQFGQYGVDPAQMGEQQRSQMQLTHGPSGKQTPVSLGRLAAIQVAEPGTRNFHMLSGVVDAGKQVLLDPADWALGGIGKANKLRKFLYTAEELSDATLASRAMRSLGNGLVGGGTRKTVLGRTVDDWLSEEQGRGFMKWIQSQEGEEAFGAIYDVLGKNNKGAVNGALVRQLADETDIDKIQDLLHHGFTQGNLKAVPKEPGGASRWYKDNIRSTQMGTYLGRMASVTNSKMLDIHDPDSALATLDTYIRNFGLSDAERNRLLYKAAEINPDQAKYAGELGDQDLYSQYFGLVKEATNSWIADLGLDMDDPMAKAMNKIFDSPDAHRSFWVNNAGDDVMFGGTRFTVDLDGKKHAQPSALLFSQFLNQGIPLMDSKKIRSMMRRDYLAGGFLPTKEGASGKTRKWLEDVFGPDDWDKVGDAAVMNALDWTMSNLWKPAVLLRVAWPVRVIGEEQLRLGGKLMAGMFNHPLQYMALMATKDSKLLRGVARMTDDVFEDNFLDDAAYQASQVTDEASIGEALLGKSGGRSGKGIIYEAKPVSEMSPQEFSQAMTFELNQLIKDDVAPIVAGKIHELLTDGRKFDGTILDEVKKEFFGGELDYLRQRLIYDTRRFGDLSNKAFADGYIDTVFGKITHMGGGKGWMTQRHTGTWFDFDGTEISPSQLRDRMGMTVGTSDHLESTRLYAIFGDEGANEAMQGAERILYEELNHQEASRITDAMADVWDRVFDETRNPDLATQEALKVGDDLTEQYKTMPRPGEQLGDTEFFPTVEAQTGIGEWAERPSFTAAYQSNQRRALSAETNQHWMGGVEDRVDFHGAYKLGEGVLRPADEFVGMPPQTLQLADTWEEAYQSYGRAYVRWKDGQAVAVVEVILDPDTKKITGVAYSGGLDVKELTAMQKELAEAGILSLEDALKFNAGGIPFDEWLIKQGVDVKGMSRDEIWKYLDENPDILKRFEGHYDEFNEWVPGTNPRQGFTDTTRMGGFQTRLGMKEAKAESSQWPQHMPFFQVEEMGDPRIFELVATGKITDDAGETLLDWGTKRGRTNKEVRKQFANRSKYFEDNVEEWQAKAPGFLRKPTATNEAKDIKRWDEAVGTMMQMLMSRPSDKLSRSPAFRQFYWKRASEMAAYLNDDDRIKFLSAAQKSNLIQKQDVASKTGQVLRTIRRYTGKENTVDEALRHINRLHGSPQRTAEGAVTTLEQLDQVAKAYALQETRDLLYDLSKSHNATEALRIMVPFGEAWFEVGSTWLKLMKENPRNIRRMQQGISGARGSDPFRDTGPDGEQGRGFFFNDPTTGDEVFAYPGLGLIPEWMPFVGGFGEVDENLDLVGRASGLNIMAQIMPGLGPVVQIPLSNMAWSDDVENRWLRDIALPFGKSPVKVTDPGTWLSPILPTWVNKGLQAWGGKGGESNERLYHNTVIDVYKTLLMQGWSDDSPEQMRATLEHASKLAKDVTRIRALSNFAAPTAAGNLWEVRYDPQDAEGDVWAYSNLATAYRQLLDENNGDDVQTFKAFSDLFGIDPMLFAVSKTQKVLPRAVTIEAKAWEQNNEDLFESDAFPFTAYFASPDPTEGEFDYETYLDQLNDEIRQPLTPEQWGLKRNQFLGRVAYANFQRGADKRFADESQKRLWLSNSHSGLQQLFPGYGQTIPGMPSAPSLDMQVAELNRWATEPRLAASPAGLALRDYMEYRTSVIRLTQTQFGYTSETGFRSGKRSAIYRRQLRERGEALVQATPEFLPMWQQILSRELEEPEATMAPVNIAGVSF